MLIFKQTQTGKWDLIASYTGDNFSGGLKLSSGVYKFVPEFGGEVIVAVD